MNINRLLDIYPEWGIKQYSMNSDGSIDVFHDIDWANKCINELPDLKIRKVHGYFNVSFNSLTSLKILV